MATKRIMFFAMKEDIIAPIEKAENEFMVKYCLTGMFDTPDIPVFDSAFNIPNFGISKGDWIADDSFLIMAKDDILNVREVPQ
jgi:hypothetical protein